MHPFNQAHEVIKSHLLCHTADLEQDFQSVKSPAFVYAFVDTANQTYHIGKTKNWRQIHERFTRWRCHHDLSALPAVMRKVLTLPSEPYFYLGTDHEGYVYPKLKSQLSEI